jgi:hypothetical protein
MLECNAHEAGAVGQVDSLMAMLHVEALAHAAWADQHAAAPGQQGMHDAGARGTSPEPPPQMSHHRAIEALHAAHIVSLQLQNAATHTHPPIEPPSAGYICWPARPLQGGTPVTITGA